MIGLDSSRGGYHRIHLQNTSCEEAAKLGQTDSARYRGREKSGTRVVGEWVRKDLLEGHGLRTRPEAGCFRSAKGALGSSSVRCHNSDGIDNQQQTEMKALPSFALAVTSKAQAHHPGTPDHCEPRGRTRWLSTALPRKRELNSNKVASGRRSPHQMCSRLLNPSQPATCSPCNAWARLL